MGIRGLQAIGAGILALQSTSWSPKVGVQVLNVREWRSNQHLHDQRTTTVFFSHRQWLAVKASPCPLAEAVIQTYLKVSLQVSNWKQVLIRMLSLLIHLFLWGFVFVCVFFVVVCFWFFVFNSWRLLLLGIYFCYVYRRLDNCPFWILFENHTAGKDRQT